MIVLRGHVVSAGRVAGVGVELDRLNILDVDRRLPASSSGVAADQDGELLVLETDDLTSNHAAVFKTDRIGEQRSR